MNQMNTFDVIIIGGGPAGCSCALYTARSNLSTIILDKNPAVGALAITHKIANYPGVEGDTSGEELLKKMRVQAINYGAEYKQAQVYGISMTDSEKTIGCILYHIQADQAFTFDSEESTTFPCLTCSLILLINFFSIGSAFDS